MTPFNDYDRAQGIVGRTTRAVHRLDPCHKWTVRDVISHRTYGNLMAADMQTDDESPDRLAVIPGR